MCLIVHNNIEELCSTPESLETLKQSDCSLQEVKLTLFKSKMPVLLRKLRNADESIRVEFEETVPYLYQSYCLEGEGSNLLSKQREMKFEDSLTRFAVKIIARQMEDEEERDEAERERDTLSSSNLSEKDEEEDKTEDGVELIDDEAPTTLLSLPTPVCTPSFSVSSSSSLSSSSTSRSRLPKVFRKFIRFCVLVMRNIEEICVSLESNEVLKKAEQPLNTIKLHLFTEKLPVIMKLLGVKDEALQEALSQSIPQLYESFLQSEERGKDQSNATANTVSQVSSISSKDDISMLLNEKEQRFQIQLQHFAHEVLLYYCNGV